jgi:hypothetical protein
VSTHGKHVYINVVFCLNVFVVICCYRAHTDDE